ncbi:DUF6417 family protein [Streptomyces sp. NPDC002454]
MNRAERTAGGDRPAVTCPESTLVRGRVDGIRWRVRTADFAPVTNRWCMYLTRRHLDAVAYAFSLRGSASEAHHFARDYGVIYRTEPESGCRP